MAGNTDGICGHSSDIGGTSYAIFSVDRLARLERLTAQRPAAGFRLGAVDDAGEGIDRVAVHHDVELGQLAFLIAVEVIVGAFLLAFPFIIRWAAIAGSGN